MTVPASEPSAKAPPGAVFDVRNHVPSPLPRGWKVDRPSAIVDQDMRLVTPDAELMVILRQNEGSDMFTLGVGVFPIAGSKPVADYKVRAILECFTLRGAFDESTPGPYAAAPGWRMFEAPARAGVR